MGPKPIVGRTGAAARGAPTVRQGSASVESPGTGANGRRDMLRSVGGQLIRLSVAPSSHRAYSTGFRSWAAFRGLIGEDAYFDAAASDADKIQELLEFVAWCASEGNQAGTIANKLSAVLHFHRINLHMELPTSSPLIKRALKGVTRSHVAAGTQKECVARFRGNNCWKDRDWIYLGVQAAAFFACL